MVAMEILDGTRVSSKNGSSSSLDTEFLTTFIANWIKSGCNGNLIDLVDDAILESRTLIRESLSKLPNQSKIINELDQSTESSVNQLNKVSNLIADTVKHFDSIENELIPLVDAMREELKDQIRISEEIKASKSAKENLDYKRIPSYDDFSRFESDQPDTETILGMNLSLLTPSKPVVIKARRASIPDAPQVTDCDEKHLTRAREIVSQDVMEQVAVEENQFFPFPKCQVSKSALALFDLIMQLLGDADGIIFSVDSDADQNADQENGKIPYDAMKLYIAASKVIRLYQIMTPIKNKKLIKNSLTASALLHNNCVFIAQFLLTSPQINDAPECIKNSTDARPGFNMIASLLQEQAEKVIKDAVKEQKYKFIEFFNSSSVVTSLIENSTSNDDLKPFEFAIKKSIYLINSISKSWKDILPKTLFNHLMGSLISFIFEEIITKILSVEDISASSAAKMSEIMKYLQTELAETLIKPNDGFNTIVASSFKFNELRNSLTASLIDIVNRWGDGYGPLSVAFTDIQVKRLIRALFQNSEIRAVALSKIKNAE